MHLNNQYVRDGEIEPEELFIQEDITEKVEEFGCGIEKRINEWNEKNYNPLKKGYIKSQLNWYRKNPNRLPPNFNNPLYRELNVDKPDELAKKTKNPVSYAIKKYFARGN